MSVLVWKLTPGNTSPTLTPVTLSQQAETLDESSRLLPGGAYTTFRTYEGSKALCLGEHFRRLEETARLAGKSVQIDEGALRAALRQILAQASPTSERRFRLTLDLENCPGVVYIASEPLMNLPPSAYQEGVRVITSNLQRQLPQAKLTRFIARAEPVRRSLPPGVHEAIMVTPDGRMLEGLSSNFFAVKNGELWTAQEGVLAGVTRSLVLECAQRMNIPLRGEAIRVSDLPALEEAFISSSSRGVLPVRQIDEWVIGNGQPGALTRKLMLAYQECIRERAEPI
jgi:branched-chain amino acid aminotransferase